MDLDNPSYFTVPAECSPLRHSISSGSDRSTPPAGRHRLRTLLRSISSNSADSNHELLVLGEPRLADFAPEIAARHSAAVRSNSLKNHNTTMYSALPQSTGDPEDELSGDEVFVTDTAAHYYNFPAQKTAGIRRHSVGVMGRDRVNSGASSSRSFKEDLPQVVVHEVPPEIDEHAIRHASYPRKRCIKCTKGVPPKATNMEDIMVVSLQSSEAATLWVDFFSNYFQQINNATNRKGFKVQYVSVEELVEKDQKSLQDLANGVKLQLVVMCPLLLEFIRLNPEKSCNLGKGLLQEKTLALLLGVSDADLDEVHLKALPQYNHWQRKLVGQDQDENFTKEFLALAMVILARVWKQQSSVLAQEKSCFSVTPKKIRQGQNRVFIILTYPLQREDIVKVSVEKDGIMYEIAATKRRNPYLIKMTMPEHLIEVTAIVNIVVEKNGSIIGSRPIKCESRLREMEQILRSSTNPIEFMCQAFGFTPQDKEQLDNSMVQAFQRNLPAHFNVLAHHSTPFSAAVQAHKRSMEEYPTLLHFAAKFGLEKLSFQLLDCPGSDIALEIRNVRDKTPLDIAEENEHHSLCGILRNYANMTEMTSMYAKLKEITQSNKNADTDEDGYLSPKCIEQFYKICPSPRPIESPQTPQSVQEPSTPTGYMSMHLLQKQSASKENLSSPVQVHTPTEPKTLKKVPKLKSAELAAEDKVQKELAEIITDFKNNVHSITQVEKLVEEWKNRNDVQKSFKEKQEQLNEMRVRYEKIQLEMKNSLRKPSPFDRFKKLFSKSHKRDEKLDISTPIPAATGGAQRPVSSLSTSSSGSSGRMSTLSGCSLGDSGTHSDTEERKANILGGHTDEEFKRAIGRVIMDLPYTPVPAPKPIKLFNTKHTFETIEEKPVRPDSLPLADDFYTQFSPSGIPVQGFIEDNQPCETYINVPGQMGQHDYMNYKTPSMR